MLSNSTVHSLLAVYLHVESMYIVVTLQMLQQNKHNLLLCRYFILEGKDREEKKAK